MKRLKGKFKCLLLYGEANLDKYTWDDSNYITH